MADTGVGNNKFDEHGGRVTRQIWKWTVLAGMASYIDAGSIVALGVSLALWQEYLGLSPTLLGALAAIGPNAFGAAIGAFVGGASATWSAASVSTSTTSSSTPSASR